METQGELDPMAILDFLFGLLQNDVERGRFRSESQQEGRNRVTLD